MNQSATIEAVREYYGTALQSSADLKTSACCSTETPPPHLAAIFARIHPEVRERFYGCGSPLPPALEGTTVLDVGCGSGRDCYALSSLVGPAGRVIGIDMTPEQLDVARRHRAWHAEAFGYPESNVEFLEGYIEDLAGAGIADESVDVVVSNCVLNLSPDKARVFAEIWRVLKPGGELCFADVFADRRIPDALAEDPVVRGECLGGAMYVEDFRRTLAAVGCSDARVCASTPIALEDEELKRRVGMIGFRAMTVRAFKLDLEDRCEDYGQVARYLGTLTEHPHAFELDYHHRFEAGRPLLVCGNTAEMLTATRYAPHFRVEGDRSVHHGLFACAPGDGPAAAVDGAATGCC
jgi:SAM-dependent methyltransferase